MSLIPVSHKFLVEASLYNLSDDSAINVSDYITNIMVRKKFFSDSFPLFVVDLRTTEVIRDKIRDNDCKLNVKIMYFNSELTGSTVEQTDSEEVSPEGIVLEANIRIYDKPFSTTVAKKDETVTDGETQSEAAPFVYYRVAGIPDEILTKNEGNVNNIFSDAEPVDALVYLLTSSGIENIKLQESDNKMIYNNIIVPPVSLIPAINFLQETYSIYNNGLSIFLDTDMTYCYSPLSDNRPESNRVEVSLLSVDATGETQSLQKPNFDSSNNNVKVSLKAVPEFSTGGKLSLHSIGSETVFYSYDDFFNVVERQTSTEESFKKIRYLWNDSGRQDQENDIVTAANSSEHMKLSFLDLNPSVFNPLTEYNIVSSEYPIVNGKYISNEVAFSISTTDFKIYSGATNISLIKIK